MARRRIGQEQLPLDGPGMQGGTSLDEVAALVDWAALDPLRVDIAASAKGEADWPPLALFKALLLAPWHDLSDVLLAAALDDRASFRRFLRFRLARADPRAHQLRALPARVGAPRAGQGIVRRYHGAARRARRGGAHGHAGRRRRDRLALDRADCEDQPEPRSWG